MGEKISVIVPTYNIQPYVDRCVKSLLAQTYANIEIILVDDGSTDQSGAICDYYKEKDDRVVVLHKKNGGLSDARNAGLNYANGTWIAFVDGDDYVAENYLQRLYEAANSLRCPIAECDYLCVYGDIPPAEKGRTQYPFPQAINAKEWLNGSYSVIVCNKLYRKELFEQIRFPVGRVHEDDAVTYRLVYLAGSVAKIHDRLYYYRQRSGSITNLAFTDKRARDALAAFEEQRDFFDSNCEQEIASNCRAKLCLLLISYYLQGIQQLDLLGNSIDCKRYAKETFREIECKQSIPKRYYWYIRLFFAAPWMYRALAQRLLNWRSGKWKRKPFEAN